MIGALSKGAIPLADLVPGRTYLVRFEDCCVNGEFAAVFTGWTEDDPNDPLGDEWTWRDAMWSNGVTLSGWAWAPFDPTQRQES